MNKFFNEARACLLAILAGSATAGYDGETSAVTASPTKINIFHF
jgi:hypothetical protein